MQIKDRTFMISGGSSGLGLATAIILQQNGANVSILDINPPSSTTNDSLNPSRLLFTKTDVASTNALQTAVKATIQWTKETSCPLSGVICCAGIGKAVTILPKQDASATHDTLKYYDMSHFDHELAVNLRGTVDLIRLTLPHMALNKPSGEDDERGVVVVVSSIAAYEAQVGQVAYAASKGAVSSIVLPMARELGAKAGIRAMGIAPGVFDTGLTNWSKKTPSQMTTKQEEVSKKKWSSNNLASLLEYPKRMGHGSEFARMVKEIIENPMHNGFVIRLDGAMRARARL